MTNYRVVLVIAIVVGGIVYGGLIGIQTTLDDSDEPAVEEPASQNSTLHLDRAGRPTVVGEIVNGFETPITNITVTVTFSRNGRQVKEVTDAALKQTITAGASAPFDIHMPSENSVDGYEVSVDYERGSSVEESGLVVTDSQVVSEAQDQVDVSGTVRNTVDERLVLSKVIATFYDANGSVIGARILRPERILTQQEAFTVRIQFQTLGDIPSYARRFDSFDLTAVANQPTEENQERRMAKSAT